MKQLFIRNKFFIYLCMLVSGMVTSLVLGIVSFAVLIGQVSLFFAILTFLGWFGLASALVFLIINAIKLKLEREVSYFLEQSNKNLLKKILDLIRYIYGYREDVAENISFYKKISEKSYPLANVLGSFALTTKLSDTILLARWEHDDNTWFYHVGGSPIHEKQVSWMLDRIKYDCLRNTDGSTLIWKKKELEH